MTTKIRQPWTETEELRYGIYFRGEVTPILSAWASAHIDHTYHLWRGIDAEDGDRHWWLRSSPYGPQRKMMHGWAGWSYCLHDCLDLDAVLIERREGRWHVVTARTCQHSQANLDAINGCHSADDQIPVPEIEKPARAARAIELGITRRRIVRSLQLLAYGGTREEAVAWCDELRDAKRHYSADLGYGCDGTAVCDPIPGITITDMIYWSEIRKVTG